MIEIYEDRLDEDESLRYTPRTPLREEHGLLISERNGREGVTRGETLLVPSVFDKVSVWRNPFNTFVVGEIDEKKRLWVITPDGADPVSESFFDKILISQFYEGVILIKEGKENLYSPSKRRFFFEQPMEMVSQDTSVLSVWGKKSQDEWIFVNTGNGAIFRVNEKMMPLEHKDFIAFMKPDGEVCLLSGDTFILRQDAIKKGGRLQFHNSRTDKTYFSDPAGFILNP